jgi:ribonucleoside-diphosphate reductase alpha chain
MQAALQPYVDNAISKTVNVPPDFPYRKFHSLFERAYDLELKGCTVFRPNPIAGAVLTAPPSENVHCCGLDRECD